MMNSVNSVWIRVSAAPIILILKHFSQSLVMKHCANLLTVYILYDFKATVIGMASASWRFCLRHLTDAGRAWLASRVGRIIAGACRLASETVALVEPQLGESGAFPDHPVGHRGRKIY